MVRVPVSWVAVSIVGYDYDGQDVLDNELLLASRSSVRVLTGGYTNRAEIAAVAARTEESAQRYAERFGVPHSGTDYRELLALPAIETPAADAAAVGEESAD